MRYRIDVFSQQQPAEDQAAELRVAHPGGQISVKQVHYFLVNDETKPPTAPSAGVWLVLAWI